MNLYNPTTEQYQAIINEPDINVKFQLVTDFVKQLRASTAQKAKLLRELNDMRNTLKPHDRVNFFTTNLFLRGEGLNTIKL